MESRSCFRTIHAAIGALLAGCENMESLQIRRVPFGSLTAGLQNRVLTVAGDDLGNDVVIQKNITGQTTVAGIHQTLINGVAPVNSRSLAVFQGVTDVVVKTNGGQHTLFLLDNLFENFDEDSFEL